MTGEPELLVIGHKNPDTDSICAALAYSRYKQEVTGTPARAFRAGNVNPQTSFVLDRLGVTPPPLLTDVYPKIRDIMIDRPGLITLRPDQPLGRARELLVENRFTFLPVVDEDDRCLGMVTTLGLTGLPLRVGSLAGTEVDIDLDYLKELLAPESAPGAPREEKRFRGTVTLGPHVSPGHGQRPARGRSESTAGRPVEPGEERHGGSGGARAVDPEQARHAGPRLILLCRNGSGDREKNERRETEATMGPADLVIHCGIDTRIDPPPHRDAADASGDRPGQSADDPEVIFTPAGLLKAAVAVTFARPVREFTESPEPLFSPAERVSDVQQQISRYNQGGFIVCEEDGTIAGVITRVSFLNEARFHIALVDHNELSQAVEGIEHADIVEIVDHHRIGTRSTDNPITFINRVVGSTCTIITEMYRSAGRAPDPATAGLMLAAVLSDTVILRSPTTTDADHAAAHWLAELAGLDPEAFGREMFEAGSVIATKSPKQLIAQDRKTYTESGYTFSVSQIETVGFEAFHARAEELKEALAAATREAGCRFGCLMVTDITEESTRLLVSGSVRVQEAIDYPQVQPGIYELTGVLSRKKQLLPYLMDVLRSLS